MANLIIRKLAHLLDVLISAPTDGQVLTWNDVDQRWENADSTGGGGGGSVDSVVAGTGIDVDATDPENPEVALDAGTQASLALADGSHAYADAAVAALSSVYQPLDSDLTAIAALATTSFGRTFLSLADAAAARTKLGLGSAAVAATSDFDAAGAAAAAQAASQPLDSDLTAIAALTTTTFGRSLLALADAGAGRTALGLGTLATQSGTFSGTSSGTNTGDQTSVSGNAGTATKLAATKNIDGQAFDGSADITVIAPGTHAATSKATPVDADELPLVDSAASNVLKKLTWANLKATLKTYFDTLYAALVHTHAASDITSGTIAQARLGTGSAGAGTKVLYDDQTYKTPSAGTVPEVRVFHSADQAIANLTFTTLAFNSERFDTDTIHDTVTNNSRLTCKTAGKYVIVGNANFAGNVSGSTGARGLVILLNGTTFIGFNRFLAITTVSTSSDAIIATIYDLAVNDYVELQAWQSSGGSLNVVSAGNWSPEFMMVRVG